jgi:hypothetical protein
MTSMARYIRSVAFTVFVSFLTILSFSQSTSYSQVAAFEGETMAFEISSPDFPNGGQIPKKFTCDAADVSPALSWSGAPSGTAGFALIADDPDAPSGTWTHWVLYGLPASVNRLPESVPKVDEVQSGGRQGRNDFHKIGYGGPCPPPGKIHRYFFTLYALDENLSLKPGVSRAELEQAMQGHVLGSAQWIGKYAR